jgi:hypothetical protein
MSNSALIASGLIVQVNPSQFPVPVSLVWVDISTITPAPQVGWSAVETSGAWAFTAPSPPPAPTPAQLAAAAYSTFIGGGLTVTSTATPGLNGVYPIDADSQVTISTEAQFVSTFAEFTNQQTTNLEWQTQNGAMATFPTTQAFMAFAKAAAQAVAAAKLAAATGAAMPSGAVTIP